MVQLLILIGGLALIFLTEHDTFGWVLTGLAVGLFVFQLLVLGVFLGVVNKSSRSRSRSRF